MNRPPTDFSKGMTLQEIIGDALKIAPIAVSDGELVSQEYDEFVYAAILEEYMIP